MKQTHKKQVLGTKAKLSYQHLSPITNNKNNNIDKCRYPKKSGKKHAGNTSIITMY